MRANRRLALGTLASTLATALLPRTALAQIAAGAHSGIAALLAQPLTAETLAMIRTALGTPGMAAGWATRSAAPVLLADGLRAAGHPEAVEAQDKWHIGSITKSFTATLFARAVEAGAIGWDTRLGTVLRDVPRHYRKLSAIELLSHHAGLAANIPMPDLLALPRIAADARISRRHYADLALAMPPIARRRERFSYSNAGYVLAARMLEEVTGLAWEDLLAREVLQPLGLASAGFGPPGTPDSIDQPRGHDNAQPIFQDNPAAMAPSGGLHLSLPDLIAYLRAHRDRSALLAPASWAQLHQPRFGSDYALGWFVDATGALWHNGSNTAWYAEAAVEPQRDLAMALCCNDAALLGQLKLLLPAMRAGAMTAP